MCSSIFSTWLNESQAWTSLFLPTTLPQAGLVLGLSGPGTHSPLEIWLPWVMVLLRTSFHESSNCSTCPLTGKRHKTRGWLVSKGQLNPLGMHLKAWVLVGLLAAPQPSCANSTAASGPSRLTVPSTAGMEGEMGAFLARAGLGPVQDCKALLGAATGQPGPCQRLPTILRARREVHWLLACLLRSLPPRQQLAGLLGSRHRFRPASSSCWRRQESNME